MEQPQEQPGATPEQRATGRQTVTLAEAARRLGISVQALRQRVKRGRLSEAQAIDQAGRTVAGVYLDELPEQGSEQSGATAEQAQAGGGEGMEAQRVAELRDLLRLAHVEKVRLMALLERGASERERLLLGGRASERPRRRGGAVAVAAGALLVLGAGAGVLVSDAREARAAERDAAGRLVDAAVRAEVAEHEARESAQALAEEQRARREAEARGAALLAVGLALRVVGAR